VVSSSLRENYRIWEARGAHRRSLGYARDDNSSWKRYLAFPNKIVIPSVPGFPASPLSLATTYVVLPKENHMQSTEAATLDRKSGEAEGSAASPRASQIPEFSRRLSSPPSVLM